MTAYDALGQAYEMSETGDLESVIKNLSSLGYLIIRDPAHAPEAVEEISRRLCCPRGCEFDDDCKCADWADYALAAITAYIERAKG